MVAARPKQLHWIKQVHVPVALPGGNVGLTTRERVLAALADRPRTVA